jgi:phage terminase small subunit
MVQRGRKSAAAAAAADVVVIDVARIKPEPPKYLTNEQAEIWRITVDAMKAGSFPAATHPLLETYCMCVSRARFIEKELRETDLNTDFKRFKMLSSMQARQSSMIAMLATRLRILPKNNSRQNRHESPHAKPWEIRGTE